jgi:hypothetical protein
MEAAVSSSSAAFGRVLVVGKLQSLFGPTCMRSVESGIHDWQASLATPAGAPA